jgi:hypothetical protein
MLSRKAHDFGYTSRHCARIHRVGGVAPQHDLGRRARRRDNAKDYERISCAHRRDSDPDAGSFALVMLEAATPGSPTSGPSMRETVSRHVGETVGGT